jgi:glycerophosphoryl diester phosphodiesterase
MVQRPMVFGHGPDDGSGPAINTLESFAWCRDLGADGVELDVRRTADDAVVVIHDSDLHGRPIADLHRRELPAFVPDLADALDACAGMVVNVELKNFPSDPGFDPDQRLTHLLLALLEHRAQRDQVLVSCFDVAALDLVQQRAAHLRTAMLLLSRRPAPELLDAVVEHGHATVHPYDTMVDRPFMAAALERGLTVNPWTLEVGADRLRALVELGVDGLITPEVTAARAVIDTYS